MLASLCVSDLTLYSLCVLAAAPFFFLSLPVLASAAPFENVLLTQPPILSPTP